METAAEVGGSSLAVPLELRPPAGTSVTVSDDQLATTSTEAVSTASTGTSATISTTTTVIIISSVTAVTGIGSLIAGIVTICLPAIARDILLAEDLLLWPSSIFALTCGCALLPSGALADLFGSRLVYLLGCFFQAVFTLACGLSRDGTQMIVFRAFAGVAASMCLPSAVSLITRTFPPGKSRNVAFASMGSGQPLGFSIGLTLGGVLADTVGWRWGFYICSAVNILILLLGLKWLPALSTEPVTWARFTQEVDWLGALLASSALAMISYVFAVLTDSTSKIASPASIALITSSVLVSIAFVFWVGRQERLGRPAIVPNSLWRNRVFTTICLDVFLVGGAFNATEALTSFFFQYVQHLSAINASLRFLPAPAGGVIATVLVGLFVHRVHANLIVLTGIGIACVAPLLMAVTNPLWPFWYSVFAAMLTNAIGADALYTVSNLLVTSSFPNRMQATAGGVYNTIAQVGKSLGLASSAAIASAVTVKQGGRDLKGNAVSLLEGYRAAFWYCLALNILTLLLSMYGLRKIGKVGLKKD